ncbi:hypothetical protein JCM15765_00140 [Paradesulfitobacterium aromaticivorans]
MLNNLTILKEARELGSLKTLADVDLLLAGYDYPTLRTAEKPNYSISLYDKVSPINGIPASTIMTNDHPIGEVYLIYIGGRLVYLQKHDPEQIGFVPMDATRAMEAANTIVSNHIESVIDARVHQEVMAKLLA